MKKLLFLFLLTFTTISYSQTTLANKLKITSNTTDNTASKVNVQDATGLINTIPKLDLIDVLEYASAINLPTTGVTGKIYITIDNKKLYRWNGTIYQELASANISGKEDIANKQNSLTPDGTGTKYPTVDAVNAIDLQKVINVGGYAELPSGGGSIGIYYFNEGGEGTGTFNVNLTDSISSSNSSINIVKGSIDTESSNSLESSRIQMTPSEFNLSKRSLVAGDFNTNVTFSTPIENTSLNFPAKTVAGTYTLATTDEISTLDSNVVHKTGNETITGSKTFQTDTEDPSITILNGSTNAHPAQRIINAGDGNGLEIEFTTGTGDAIAVFDPGNNNTFKVSRYGDVNSNIEYIKSSLKILNSDADLYGDISLNFDRYLFKNKSGDIQFLTQNSGFSTYKTNSISGTFSNIGLTTNRTFTLPDVSGTLAVVSQTITNGVTDKSPSEDAVFDALALKVGGSGTTNYIPKFTSTSGLGNSQIFDNGTNVGIGTTNPLSLLQIGKNLDSVDSIQQNVAVAVASKYSSVIGNNYNVMGLYGTTINTTNIYNQTTGEDAKNFFFGQFSNTSYFNNNRFSIVQGGVERLTIGGTSNTGNVGINVTSPISKFHVNGLSTFQGTTASDTAPLSAEQATTGSGTNWSGTNFTSGYTHTTGDASPLTTTIIPTVGGFYQLAWVITNRTAGTVRIQFGDYSIGTSTTGGTAPIIQTTTPLSITPTTTFDGTITFSIKSIGVSSPVSQLINSIGTVQIEARTSTNSTNTFIGLNVGRRNTTGGSNTGFGTNTLRDITSGNNNVGFGYNAALQTTTGVGNTALGVTALQANTSGGANTAIGTSALYSNTSAFNNTGIGYQSLYSNTTGAANTAIGVGTLFSNLVGNYNTIFGYSAGRYIADNTTPITDISYSTFIGANTKALANSQTNQIVIGTNQTGLGSNSTIIGGVGNTKTAIVGRLLLGTTVDDGINQLQVSGNILASPATLPTQVVVKSQLDAIRPYKVYTALMTQSGTSAPVATVLENTLGGTVVWTRTSSGSYVGTLAGAFVTNKTVILYNASSSSFSSFVKLNTSNNTIDWQNGSDDRMLNNGTMIEIRVYN